MESAAADARRPQNPIFPALPFHGSGRPRFDMTETSPTSSLNPSRPSWLAPDRPINPASAEPSPAHSGHSSRSPSTNRASSRANANVTCCCTAGGSVSTPRPRDRLPWVVERGFAHLHNFPASQGRRARERLMDLGIALVAGHRAAAPPPRGRGGLPRLLHHCRRPRRMHQQGADGRAPGAPGPNQRVGIRRRAGRQALGLGRSMQPYRRQQIAQPTRRGTAT